MRSIIICCREALEDYSKHEPRGRGRLLISRFWLRAALIAAVCTITTTARTDELARHPVPVVQHPQTETQRPTPDAAKRQDATATLNGHRFDLSNAENVAAFVQEVKRLRSLSKEEKAESKAEKKAGKEAEAGATQDVDPGVEKDQAPVRKAATGKSERDWSPKKVRNGLKALEQIAEKMQSGEVKPVPAIPMIQEIAWAVESNFVTPYFWRSRLELADLLIHGRDMTLNASGRGNASNPASNLATYSAPDLSKIDPKPSTFWSPPGRIADKDLYVGSGRTEIPDFAGSICTYSGPHKGYGVHPSFEVEWRGEQWKVKFGEERSSGPFGSRIYSALGYPTEMQDYTPEVKIRWDRRILSEFNSRQVNEMRITLLKLPVSTVRSDPYSDPFDYIRYAVMKDGSRADAKSLRAGLFPHRNGKPARRHPETDPAAYDGAFEIRIDYLVMNDASISSKEKSSDSKEIGFWDYNSLGHPELRELRGLAILDAWLDNWDVRWGNNRLNLTRAKDGTYRLEHVVSDMGSLFGNSSGMVRQVHGKWKQGLYDNEPNDYVWSFTHSQPAGKTTAPIRDYMPDSRIDPFYEMNLDDARWMARQIAQLSEEQLKAALIGSGFDASTARLLVEKLVARRDAMIRDFRLDGEIALLRPKGVDKHLSYNPETDGPFAAIRPGGEKCVARTDGETVLVKGELRTVKITDRAAAARTRANPGLSVTRGSK